MYQLHFITYTFSIFYRQFKAAEDVPAIYLRKQQVLLGIFVISIFTGLTVSYNISSDNAAKIYMQDKSTAEFVLNYQISNNFHKVNTKIMYYLIIMYYVLLIEINLDLHGKRL